ncbi:V-type ATP synthase subunit A [Fusibacter sp. 3D3]|uniref:V-type ATP synthase subunit A n=1 Tax=Fusibacter sp. 3D3 TaxID=1048380 RepID=UPI000858DEB1|nr:V-type ATP synthase subunit A [Fusibacter sp. 3D3]GAU77905.1 V-type ATP synthase subunit A [Fusibacter sp. 3D3]
MKPNEGKIIYVNGPVIKGTQMERFKMREMVLVGENKLIAEVIGLNDSIGTVQVYEETEGLELGAKIYGLGTPLSLKLGPGLIGNIFDGIGRPLIRINEMSPNFMPLGIGLLSIDLNKVWSVKMQVKEGDKAKGGEVFAQIEESGLIIHKVMIPTTLKGTVVEVVGDGDYNLETTLIKIETDKGEVMPVKMYQEWPVRKQRPIEKRLKISKPLITGQRIFDMFFPIAKGGTAAIPGGFGTGKTMTQHQLAKWSDADIIIYIGCGERGNEMTDVLEEFPKLIDPKSGKAIMERTILIANTSNMPVAAREASIYTGITMAEYFRDMGYHVAIMADSTSRWAEALREISGRLEEMPAEEGYPAYLSHRLAEFYERAGYVKTLGGEEGSITIIGAISPAGGDFSEPVTENTKRFVNAFLALDRKLAYARHYPAINWLSSYSGYLKMLGDWYADNVDEDAILLRSQVMKLLQEESKLLDIVQLVGEDVLPDSQRLVLEIARIVKTGFLQQNAFHKEDAFVPIEKQYLMLKTMWHLYERALGCAEKGIPMSKIRDTELFEKITKMKYNIPNNQLEGIQTINKELEDYYDALLASYN